MYIDTILLNTPLKVLFKPIANGQLQQAMTQPRSARDLEENKEILDRIAATAAIGVCIDESQRADHVDKFNAAVMRLEGPQIT
jgi:hypothetical protein